MVCFFWFHHNVRFSLTTHAILIRFRPQFSTTDENIAIWNNDRSLSVSSKTYGKFDAMLHAKCFLTSLSAMASYLILQATLFLLNFLFGQSFEIRREQTTRLRSIMQSLQEGK